MDAHAAGTSSTGRRARSGRRCGPRWWVVALGVVGVAIGTMRRMRHDRLEQATRAFHEQHGPPQS